MTDSRLEIFHTKLFNKNGDISLCFIRNTTQYLESKYQQDFLQIM